MVPQILATIQAATTGERRTRALARYGATGGLAAVLGQVLGGVLVAANIDGLGWRPIFLVNVPIGLVGLVLARRYVPDTRHGAPAPIDGTGTVLLGLTVLTLLVPLTEGRSLRWPAWTIAMLVISPLAAIAFGRYERRAERAGRAPLVPPSLLRHRSMRGGLVLALPFFAGFGAFMFCYALLVQEGLHASALTAGLGLVPMAATFLFASLSTSRLLARFGAKVLAAGGLLQAAGLIILGVTVYLGWPHLSVIDLAPGLAIAGLGQGLVMSPLFGIVLSEVPRGRGRGGQRGADHDAADGARPGRGHARQPVPRARRRRHWHQYGVPGGAGDPGRYRGRGSGGRQAPARLAAAGNSSGEPGTRGGRAQLTGPVLSAGPVVGGPVSGRPCPAGVAAAGPFPRGVVSRPDLISR